MEWDLVKDHLGVKLCILLLYAVVCILGVCGNGLVLFVVIRRPAMRTITNIFIANLAVSDIIMSVVATPFTPFALLIDDWFLPASLCKALPMTMAVSVYVSTLTSMAISADRFFVIARPSVERMRTGLCGVIIVCVWLVALFVSLPLLVYQKKSQKSADSNQSICVESWPISSSREVFTIVSFCLQFIIPCLVIIYCYYQVSQILRHKFDRKMNLLLGSGTHWRQEQAEIRRKRRTNKMLIAMIGIFVLCWIPLNVLWIVTDVHQSSSSSSSPPLPLPPPSSSSSSSSFNATSDQILRNAPHFTLIFSICHLIAMSSVVYNPFLYAGLNETFLNEFRLVCPTLFNSCLFSKQRKSEHLSSAVPKHCDSRTGRFTAASPGRQGVISEDKDDQEMQTLLEHPITIMPQSKSKTDNLTVQCLIHREQENEIEILEDTAM